MHSFFRQHVAEGLRMLSMEWVTCWDFWLLALMCKDNGTKPHSEDQLRLCYLPKVNIPLRKAGVNVQGSLSYPV